MNPNKDNFMVSYIGIHDSRDNEKLKEQIFKWKEDSEQWKIYLDGGMNNLFEIHERLTKEIEAFKHIDSDYRHFEVEELLQEIMGEKK